MKKKIANGLELLLMLVSFILLWLPTLKIGLAASNNTSLITDGSIIGFTERGRVYVIFFLYAVTALMCIISIIAKPEHRDGKMHIIMPILLFLYCASAGSYEVGTVEQGFKIVANNFPVYLFLGLHLGIIIISIAKRSTLIAGLPKPAEVKQESTKADELKKYKDLLDSGAITQEEYDAKKKELLG